MNEEQTHRLSVDLDDNVGVIDLFVTISGITPCIDGLSETDSSVNISFDAPPSKITEEDTENYVRLEIARERIDFFMVFIFRVELYQNIQINDSDYGCWQS